MDKKHLWEIENDYYCYTDDEIKFDNFKEFLEDFGDAGDCYNLVFII
jgi:hypothetical protein